MRVLVAMSGGVDSTLAAVLLKERGCDVVGLNMSVWKYDHPDERAAAERQLAAARAAAERYGFDLHQVDLREPFREEVVEYFVREYLRGRTPNPCVHCNRQIKFGRLLECAERYGCEKMATGHYARVETHAPTGRLTLRRAPENDRDQTYFLNRLMQEQLARFLPVLGELTKDDVRRLARERELEVADKPESREICFLPDDDYRAFLSAECGGGRFESGAAAFEPGEIVDGQGRVLGQHGGVANFTIGQRRGLGIAHSAPLYVVALDVAGRRVVVGERERTYARTLTAGDVNWMALEPPGAPLRVSAQIRYRRAPQPATLTPLDDGRIEVRFDEPQSAIAPGQALAAYDPAGLQLYAGAWIDES